MAFDWEHVEAIRAEQDSARNRRDLNTLPTNEVSNEIYNSPSGREAKIPGLDHWEQMIQKVRTQLIDYIIEHGLVQGFEYDGINEPIKNGKIVITADMLKRVTDRFGYFREKETLEFVEKYLPEHHYVADENYVHTDNNYTDTEKAKLEGIADGAEVNKVISVLFNGVESIDPETRIATITITSEDVKEWYEQNPDTNAFTDAEKAKLESININELSNKVEDVTLDGETVVKNKVAIFTAKKIKDSYESNANTNAFTDADKTLVEQVLPELQKGVNQHEQRIDALENSQATQDAEIKDAKDSITELGDEVNSVAGRVTTLEASQKVQDSEISNLKAKDTTQDGRLNALETSEATQDADILQLKEDIKNAGKVDDVTVDGVSVVENKIAKIPAIPSANDFVPYSGATKDVNIGNHNLVVATTKYESLSTRTEAYSLDTNIGTGKSEKPGVSIETRLETEYASDGSTSDEKTTVTMDPREFTVRSQKESSSTGLTDVWVKTSINGLKVATADNAISITPTAVKGLADPVEGKDATNKKYVDESIAAIPKTDTSNLVPYTGATNNVNLGGYGLVSGKTESGKEYSAGITPTEIITTSKSKGITSASALSGEGIGFGEINGAGSFFISMENNTETGRVVAKLSKLGGPSAELGSLKLADPVLGNEAATKKYVDTKVGEMGGKATKTMTFLQNNVQQDVNSEWTNTYTVDFGDPIGIPMDDLLSISVWISAGTGDSDMNNATLAIDYKYLVLQSNDTFNGIKFYTKKSVGEKVDYKVFAKVTYRK